MTTDLSGRVAVVTGGASGIGEACVRMMAERGATVVIADIDKARADQVAESVGGQGVEVDVTSEEGIEEAARFSETEVGATDILVTSAGVTQTPTGPDKMSLEEWDRVMRIDLRGTWISAVAFGNRMARRGRGSIVTIASITGMRSSPLHSYGPAKAAVISMTANLAAEWGRSGVRVNGVAPGYTRTPLLQEAIDRRERDPSTLTENSALGRLVEPEEVARMVCFLGSEESAAITGVTIPVDVGWLATGPWHTYGGLPPARAGWE